MDHAQSRKPQQKTFIEIINLSLCVFFLGFPRQGGRIRREPPFPHGDGRRKDACPESRVNGGNMAIFPYAPAFVPDRDGGRHISQYEMVINGAAVHVAT
ncbi:hypothetical protein [Novacetimonas pomaceti]|uniref:hypothetical protein n=1 Tax=Novacetimonas pomaceti TaxID=2021998 RepID=UPI001057A92C|nr:hypothetical protein [Novacetimonas pomaceti]